MNTPQTRWSRPARLTGGALAVALLALGLVAGPAAQADSRPVSATLPTTVSADPLPTWQLTGVVWSQVVVGTTVYATGNFTKARPPGMWAGGPTEITVSHLFAYDIVTGNRVTSFNHSLNAPGLAITASPDGRRVYVGGDFTAVNGLVRQHVAAFDTSTGALVSDFAPVANGKVRALTASADTLYVGGGFQSAGGVPRNRLAAFATATGALRPWAPTADNGEVWSLALTPDRSKVVVGGQFSTLNTAAVYGLGAVDATTGTNLPWAASGIIRDSGNGAINSLTTDGTWIYGSGFAFGAGGLFEGSFALDPANGAIRWLVDCQGDTYDVEPVGPVVYSVSHAHNCSMIGGFPDTSPRSRWQYAQAFTTAPTGVNGGPNMYGWNYRDKPAPTMLHWYPKLGIGTATGQYQAAWSIASSGRYLALAGEFPTVNGKAQQGLTRYALPDTAAGVPANQVGPQYTDTVPVRSAPPATTATVVSPGTIRVNYGAAWDQDNERLTYELFRDRGTAAEKLIQTTTLNSSFWKLPPQTFSDTTAPPGSHTYQVRVSDPFGNAVLSPVSNTVTASGNAAPSAAFTATTSGLTATVDGSGSTDADGTIASWAWDFGDGTTGTDKTASRTYTAAGSYAVKLTVTDNAGATATTTKQVTVSAPPAADVLAADAFERTSTSGWGNADTGGAWTYFGNASNFTVGGGAGSITIGSAGSGPAARLPISSTDTDLRLTFSLDKASTGGGQIVTAVPRGDQSNGYQAKLQVQASGAMVVSLVNTVSGTETVLGTRTVSTTFTPGTEYVLRVQAVGSGTTNLATKVWRADSTEPSTWAVSATSSTASLQGPAGIAVRGYLSGSSTSAPVKLSMSSLTARRTAG